MLAKIPAKAFGIASIVLTAEFWLHILVPYLRENVPYHWWPELAFVQLSLAGFFGIVAGIRGSRIWFLVGSLGLLTLVFIYVFSVD